MHYWGDAPADRRALDIRIGEADDWNRGSGTAMMKLAIARCFSVPEVTAIFIDPLWVPDHARWRLATPGRVLSIREPGQNQCEADVTADVEGGRSRYQDRLTRVEIHLSDVNSPKGGTDCRCVLEARPAGRHRWR